MGNNEVLIVCDDPQFLAERICSYHHAYTLYSAVRPFGCSVMIGVYDEDGPQMYLIDPSGMCHVSCDCVFVCRTLSLTCESVSCRVFTSTMMISQSVLLHLLSHSTKLCAPYIWTIVSLPGLPLCMQTILI